MRHAYTCAPAYWAHHSWLERGQPVRDERTARAAHAFLFTRYPQLVQVALADVPPALPIWPRPACARLCRIVAALAFAPSLRRVVAVQARAAFAAGVAPHMLREIQRHARANTTDVNLEPTPSLFSRRDMTAAGLALTLRAAADSRYAFWWSLRLPREISEAAVNYRVCDLSAAGARELVAEARRLMEAHPC
ncbi:hypothetical protein DSC91_006494 [Paraburkholderia caffeinilytica]|uniref:Type III secretion protein n=1 Tax=Paraburkholderia caffeinilytica TaxID=1761016 RepID=A0ABQ1M3Q2_9BURK|nr:hypothetical protein [Paraburkholderia caffeinilytica]AXL53185.1 hypothetical protein DSC91_006494 [Paraburkholderia caffeinilytica]GGC32249.1 hypothetical protein GCM10011400_18630 [Paraburkholderia caffeinilytica]CAB3796525.1 hypothetical protein LMG28690_04351 [Paraburkholderia caffeinilytica]